MVDIRFGKMGDSGDWGGVGEFAVAVAAAAMRPVMEDAGRSAEVELLVLRVEVVLEGPPAPGTAVDGGRERSMGAAGPE